MSRLDALCGKSGGHHLSTVRTYFDYEICLFGDTLILHAEKKSSKRGSGVLQLLLGSHYSVPPYFSNAYITGHMRI
jgi:hypothetical protein